MMIVAGGDHGGGGSDDDGGDGNYRLATITETQGFTIFGSRGVGKNLRSHPF